MASALIPFCLFGDNVGEIISLREDFIFPVCTMFQPTILDGQQCYEQKYDLFGGQGQDQGFALVIDINDERLVHFGMQFWCPLWSQVKDFDPLWQEPVHSRDL